MNSVDNSGLGNELLASKETVAEWLWRGAAGPMGVGLLCWPLGCRTVLRLGCVRLLGGTLLLLRDLFPSAEDVSPPSSSLMVVTVTEGLLSKLENNVGIHTVLSSCSFSIC